MPVARVCGGRGAPTASRAPLASHPRELGPQTHRPVHRQRGPLQRPDVPYSARERRSVRWA
eukprot:3788320-Pyramimonas_sp.AAC.1